MQSTATPASLQVILRWAILLCFFAGVSMQRVFAQQYVNGNLSTGATAKNGTAAPSGYTWSELQNDAGNTTESNTNLGFGASITNGTALADDFTVPTGSTWNVTKFTCYAYSTNYTGATSPFTDLRVRIHSSSPLAGATTIVFGDLTTNRLTASSDALMYRIGNTAVPAPGTTNTNRRIWKLEANISVSLPAGTYWIEWQSNPGTLTSNFTPGSTIVGARTQPGYNAIQKTGATGGAAGTWAALSDAGNPASAPDVAMDMPFIIDYSTAATTPPSCATGLAPANNATNVAPNGGLSWAAVSGATSYDVYLGTSATPPLVGNVTGTNYPFSPNLNLGTMYHYRIVPKNSAGAATGCATLMFNTATSFCILPTLPSLSPDTSYCGSGSATLRVTGGSLNGAASWAWYSGACGSGGTAVGSGTSITVSPANTTTYYVRAEGGCVTPGTGTCAQVVVTKTTSLGAPVINPVSPVCLGSLTALTINPFTLGTTPTPDSITVNSGAISVAVPDNVADGATATLTVPALPPGAVVTSIDVTLNMTHTYPGDMIFNLQAPNGKILNLYKYNGGTFTGNAGGLTNAGWFNTRVTSTATTAFSTVPAPYNYGSAAYAPDALNTPVTGPTVQNPNGYVSTETGFSPLFTVPNGDWILAMADGGPGDLGTLTRWSIKIRYNRFEQVPSTPAVWSPAATLYTDAAGTLPYNGTTPLFQVWAKPTVNTTYSATSVSGSCSSPATTATVTVVNPAAVTVNPTGRSICEFGTTTFTADASGTTPAYQWFVDNGSGYTAITNNSNYSGATTSTLTVTGAPASWNGYLYRCQVSSFTPCTQSVNTTAAALTINPTPVVNVSVSPFTRLLPGISTTLSASSNPAGSSYVWNRNGSAVTGQSGATLPVTVENLGSYTVRVTDVNGCVNTSAAVVIADSASTKLFITPNPNNGQFNLRYYSLPGNTLPRVVLIYDEKGALVYNRSYTIARPYDNMDINFSRLSKGVYLVNLLDATGRRLATGKVLVQ